MIKKCFVLLISLLLLINIHSPLQAKEIYNVDSRYMSVRLINEDQTTEELFQKNGDAIMYPASMTKVMTVYVAMLHLLDLEQSITIMASDLAGLSEMGASVAGFRVNDELTVKDVLYGSMLSSGADASRALARVISGSESAFVELMNETAQQLGLDSTHFVNSTGLHDENHHSTTNDLIKLMEVVLTIPTLKEMISTMEYTTTKGHRLTNSLVAYSEIGGHEIGHIVGGKTGWTPEAGYCLLSFSQLDNKIVVIASGDGFDYGGQLKDHNTIYTSLFDETHTLEIYPQSHHFGAIPIEYASSIKEYPLILEAPILVDVPKIINQQDISSEITLSEPLQAPIEANTDLAILTVKLFNKDLIEPIVFQTEEAIQRNFFIYAFSMIGQWFSQPVVYLSLLGVVVLAILGLLGYYLVNYLQRRPHKRNPWRL